MRLGLWLIGAHRWARLPTSPRRSCKYTSSVPLFSSTFSSPSSSPSSPTSPPASYLRTAETKSTHTMASTGTENSQQTKQVVSEFLQQSQEQIFENNRAWVASKVKGDGKFFTKLSSGQQPDYL
ncbi:unnamed protein product, partial [Diplocarpon coronariae]